MKDLEFIIIATALYITGILMGTFIIAPDSPIIEKCPEDSVLIGHGDFEKGKWDIYVCGPAVDDYK